MLNITGCMKCALLLAGHKIN